MKDRSDLEERCQGDCWLGAIDGADDTADNVCELAGDMT